MYCPFCSFEETKVIDSRLSGEGQQVRRRRECLRCGERFTTFESAELVMPRVVKSDATREPFDEAKLRSGMVKALEKRPVAIEAVDAAVNHVCHKLRTLGEREVPARSRVRPFRLRLSQLPGRRRIPRGNRQAAAPSTAFRRRAAAGLVGGPRRQGKRDATRFSAGRADRQEVTAPHD